MNDAYAVGQWSIVGDPSAAGGPRDYGQNLGAPKVSTPLASPGSYVDLGFFADAMRLTSCDSG